MTPEFRSTTLDNEREFEAQKRKVAEARAVIQNRLWRKKREAAIQTFVNDVRSKASVEENPELLSRVRVEVEKK